MNVSILKQNIMERY